MLLRSAHLAARALTLLALTAAMAHAQREFTGDIGLVNTTGNAEVTSLSVGQQLKLTLREWSVAQTFGLVYGENAGTVNTNAWRGGVRGERTFGSVVSLFALTAWERNTFAGIDSRLEEALGVAIKAVTSDRRALTFEVGAGAVQQWNSDEGGYGSFPSARAASVFRHNFTSAAYLQQAIEVLPNLRESTDLRVNTETALVAPISAHVGLKMSYVIRYDGLPQPTFKKTDGILTTGLQITY